jgi:PAS domain S-box-containing protein
LTSEKVNLRANLRLNDERNKALLNASLDAVIAMDHEGRIGEFNPAAERIFGYARGQALGRQLADLIVPERLRQQHKQGLARYLREGAGRVVNKRIEMPALRADGTEFPVELAIVPVTGANPPFFIGFLRDISERKAAERRQRFLMDELAHRSKNLLALVQALVSRGFSDKRPLAEARDTTMSRIDALSRSQDMLVRGGLQGAPLADIVRLGFEAFSDRVTATGPAVALSPRATQTFALLLHELATNAVKHGALSIDRGCIIINWRVDSGGAESRLHFRWEERDGPAVANPERRGFGRALLEQVVAQDLGASPTVHFAPTGLVYEIDAPLSAVEQPAEPDAWTSL